MRSHLVATGEIFRAQHDEVLQIVQPFLGISGDKNEIFSGVGILFKKRDALFSILQDTFSIFHLWRSMKLLEMVKRIDGETIGSCLKIMDREEANVYSPQCADIFTQFGGSQKLLMLRSKLLLSAPPVENLEGFILTLSL
ncbi:MAG: hypothetical protein AAB907_04360, partial [Patescibacteria group bacterium]